jgi:alpha-1,2-mannosyltransferase
MSRLHRDTDEVASGAGYPASDLSDAAATDGRSSAEKSTRRTRRRPTESRRWSEQSAASLVLLALSAVLWTLVGWRLTAHARQRLPLDFQVYRDAALSALHGGATYQRHFTYVHLNFTYPPFALGILTALTVLSAIATLAIWQFLSAVSLVAVVGLTLRSSTRLSRRVVVLVALVVSAASILLLQPVRSSLDFGQINFFLMLAIVFDVLRPRSAARGVLVGLAAAMKLTPLMYVTYFLMTRDRSAALRAGATFVGALVIAWLIFPRDSATYWFHQAFSPGHKGGAGSIVNQSWFGLVRRFASTLGPFTNVVWLTLCLATLATGILLARRYLSVGRPVEAILALALTELLVSPISWVHHWSWIVLLPVLLISRWRHDRYGAAAMFLLLATAIAAPYTSHSYGWYRESPWHALPGFSLLLSGALLLIVMAVTEWRQSSPFTRVLVQRRPGEDGTGASMPLRRGSDDL